MFPNEADSNYFKFEIGEIEPSAMVKWPNSYKFIDLEILVGSD